MNKTSILTAALAAAAMFAMPVMYAQTAAPTTNCPTPVKHHGKKKPVAAPCADFESQLAKQQAEIDALKAQIAGMQPAQAAAETDPIATPLAKQASADAADAANKAAAAAAAAQAASAQATATDVAYKAEAKKLEDEIESPLAIHYKGVLIQPSGFVAGESVYRSRAENADIATALSATPYPNSAYYHLSEFNGSARQSRFAVLVSSPLSWGKASGYIETDLLGAGTTSNNNQTNSYVLRVREAFGQVSLNSGFTFAGGQMWSLLTGVKKGINAGPGAEATTQQIDPNFEPGFPLMRQYELRATKSLAGGKVNLGISAEESQIVLAATINAPFNFIIGGPGASGGAFNSTGANSGSPAATGVQNYTDNLAPDIIAKVTFDPGHAHFEIGGIARFFRDRVYAQTAFSSTSSATDSTIGVNYMTPGGGVFASAYFPVTKYLDVNFHAMTGTGVGRYAAANLGDVTVRPSGILEPLKSDSGVLELVTHPTKKLDIYTTDGAEYLQRTVYTAPTGVQVGYGAITGQNDSGCGTQSAPTSNNGYGYGTGGSCTGATRYIYELMVGMTYRFYSSPTKGRFQAAVNYSYLDRMAWQGYTGATFATSGPGQFHGAQGTNGMVFTSFRYYLP